MLTKPLQGEQFRAFRNQLLNTTWVFQSIKFLLPTLCQHHFCYLSQHKPFVLYESVFMNLQSYQILSALQHQSPRPEHSRHLHSSLHHTWSRHINWRHIKTKTPEPIFLQIPTANFAKNKLPSITDNSNSQLFLPPTNSYSQILLHSFLTETDFQDTGVTFRSHWWNFIYD